MYLLVVTYFLIASGPAAQTAKPPVSPSISTEKIATYSSLNDCKKAAEAFATSPADLDPSASGFIYQTRTVCVSVPDGDAVAG